MICVLVKEARYRRERFVEYGVLTSYAHGNQRLWPEIAHLEYKGHPLYERQPAGGESHQQLRGRANDDIGTRKAQSPHRSRQTERSVVSHPLVCLAVGEGPEPGAEDVHSPNLFMVREAAQPAAPLRRNYSGRMIGKSRQHRHVVTNLRPVLREFGGTSGGGAHLRRKIL